MNYEMFFTYESILNFPVAIVTVILITEFLKSIPYIKNLNKDYTKIFVSMLYMLLVKPIEMNISYIYLFLVNVAFLSFVAGITYNLTLDKIRDYFKVTK